MPERRVWHQYITEGDKLEDLKAIRKLLNDCARDLEEAETDVNALQRESAREERQAQRAQIQLASAAAVRASISTAAIRELKKMLPTAMAQAKEGKPALLRLILRATR